MSDSIIQTHNLTVYYGKVRGVKNVNLSVQRGEAFGFLGPNGAGKTTTQRVLLDVIRPTSGSASIFGMDCRKQGVEIRKQVGYLPGELALYKDMRAAEFFDMMEYLRGHNGAKDYWRTLAERLDLDPSRRIRTFSRGNKQKVGIIAAFMNKPALLILDEPTSGLDPLVQQTVMEMVREVKTDGRTVFFSSHILPEVQAVCDRVGIIRAGELVATERVGEMLAGRFKRITLTFSSPLPAGAFALQGVAEISRSQNSVTLEVRENLAQVLSIAAQYDARDIETHSMSLEDVFLAFYQKDNGGNHA